VLVKTQAPEAPEASSDESGLESKPGEARHSERADTLREPDTLGVA
jgi:hypothetical protein